MSDQLIKETVKALKYGLSDKAGAITRECAEVSPTLLVPTPS